MTENETQVDKLAELLWNYHLMHHKLEHVDSIFVLGNHDLRIADYAIDLFKAGWSSMIIFSGGVIHKNVKLKVHWDIPEAEMFARHAIEKGIPASQILTEANSKNTGENFQFTGKLLAERGLNFKKFLLVQKPYMERRTYATGKVHWPDKTLIITSPPTSFEEYAKGDVPKKQIISFMVGDLQRIKVYGEKGFQIPQDIPADVWDAYEKLIELGFTDRLLKE
jgi:uncharacterized SAM-binding protein YcdF (DUF218 family)